MILPRLSDEIAEHKQFITYCSVVINGDKNTDPEHLGLYRDLKQETYRQGFSFDKLKEKLTTIAEAIGLHVQTPKSIHGDYYQILGVSENVGSEPLKKPFGLKPAKHTLTQPPVETIDFPMSLTHIKFYRILPSERII
jgi:hypothetical protein